ncbi:hypothetical protein acdb102_15590 [Acidothermaceae bacterium B102]|nr:hypothetical protein acdb102_15590 [Acidothermaceae bacterium B102]
MVLSSACVTEYAYPVWLWQGPTSTPGCATIGDMRASRPSLPLMSLAAAALVAVTGCLGHSSPSAEPTSAPTSAPAATPAAATHAAVTASAATSSAASSAASAAGAASAASSAAPLASAGPAFAAAVPKPTAPSSAGAAAALARMSLAQRVGQLFMVGTPASLVSSAVVHAIQADHVGNVILTGRSQAGVAATAAVTARLQRLASTAATAGVPLFVSTDQEGGLVQVLRGPGFSAIPAALTQGTWSAALVRAYAKKWGGQLRAAGVNVDLGPVLDTVPSPAAAKNNPPIGRFRREYGFTPALVSSRGGAFAEGLRLAKVAATVKHFPGLGRVTGNTDTTAGVTDTVTRRGDPYLAPFAAAVKANAPFVMMSTAIYSRLDPGVPAAFSKTIIGTVLRGDLGFTGVVVSDDLGNAKQVAAWTAGNRAINFLRAGGDMVLTVNGALLQPMYAAVLAAAVKDPAFRAQVNASALRVLVAKQRFGLISAP